VERFHTECVASVLEGGWVELRSLVRLRNGMVEEAGVAARPALYARYQAWCKAEGALPLNAVNFGKGYGELLARLGCRLPADFHADDVRVRRPGGQPERYWPVVLTPWEAPWTP
jgi:hypothetical protein